MQNVTAIALSGGIDSLVSAALLIDQGETVIGLHFLTGFETIDDESNLPSDTSLSAIRTNAWQNLSPLAEQLGIPLYIIDLCPEFKSLVVDYFINTYRSGQTPNPCLICNPLIKFNILLKRAQQYGATRIATGHYARIKRSENGRLRLLRGVDERKDQSYFLARLSQKQLSSAVLPLGDLTKDQARAIAHDKGLQPVSHQESQDVCFIKDRSYGDFLAQQPGFKAQHGPIEDIHGNIIGYHSGLHWFTIGQRRGINCPAPEPYYVVKIDKNRNSLIVGSKKDLFRTRCEVKDINWLSSEPARPIQVNVRIRYRHQAVPAIVTPTGTDTAQIDFRNPEPAITPGQGAAFYQDDEVLGGGWIE